MCCVQPLWKGSSNDLFETIQWGHHDKAQLCHVLCLCWCIHCDRLLGLHVSCFGCASCWTISCLRIWGWVTVNSIYGIVLVSVFSQIWNQWSNYDHFWSILINSDQITVLIRIDQNWSELIRIDQTWSEFNICLKTCVFNTSQCDPSFDWCFKCDELQYMCSQLSQLNLTCWWPLQKGCVLHLLFFTLSK